jgi:hypothetical protein
MKPEKNKIKNIILDYCEGDTDKYWLEFPRDDLSEMVEKIKEAVLHEFKDAETVLHEFGDAEEFVGRIAVALDNVKNYL